MATPSHAMMLREISAAGDRERTGALDVAWDSSHARLFFKFGHFRHVTLEMADGRTLAGGEALTALVAELPGEIEAATWRRTAVNEETMDLTAAELLALFEAEPHATSNGVGPPQSPEPNEAGTSGLEPPPTDAPLASTGSAILGASTFRLLPLGPVLWSDAMVNVDDLEAMVPQLPDCLLVLTCPEPRAAALVASGAITDAVWMTDGRGLSGDDAARALMSSSEGELTAYCIDDERMLTVLRTLLQEPAAPTTAAGDVEAIADPSAPIVEWTVAEQPPPDVTTPTFDLAFAYVGMSGRDGVAPSAASVEASLPAADPPTPQEHEALTWSTRDVATIRGGRDDVEPADSSSPRSGTHGPVGRTRPAALVPIRVLLSLGTYALTWRRATNRELEEFDPSLPARPARSTFSSVVAWLTALLIAAAIAVLLASTRGSFHLPFNKQLTRAETYYLIAGLALLYVTLILPFNFTAARTNLRRLGVVEEHAGIPARRRVRLGGALLLVIPVIGKLVLLAVEQRRINAIWTAATLVDSPTVDVIVERGAEPSAEADADADAQAAITAASEPEEESLPEGKAIPDWYVRGGVKAATADTDPAASAEPDAATDVDTSDVGTADDAPAAGELNGEIEVELAALENLEAPVLDEPVSVEPVPEETVEQPVEPSSIEADPDLQPVWLRIAAPDPGEAVEAVAAEETATEVAPVPAVELGATAAETPFIAPRLEIDVDALRGGLTEIAAKWLGAQPAEPVAAVIAVTRPGVDDFVHAIAAIRGMEIPGYESRIVRAMAREMHYYAAEVLCGV